LRETVPSRTELNYVGVALALVSTVFYAFVKTEVSTPAKHTDKVFNTELGVPVKSTNNEEKTDFLDRFSPLQKRILGISLAFFSGLMYGECNTPALYAQQNYESDNLLDYMFSYYTGILMTSLVYFMIYCIVKKNKPVLYNEIILPGLVSGLKITEYVMFRINKSSKSQKLKKVGCGVARTFAISWLQKHFRKRFPFQ
jgi:hypothetical protein